MRVLLCLAALAVGLSACSTSTAIEPTTEATPTAESSMSTQPSDAELGPGGWSFDRSDPETGIKNIMDAFATDEATATCIFDAWGDVANVPPAELTPELMVFEICGTSIFQLITGDPRFTGTD